MYKNKRIGVVIPAYNEAGFVGEVIETVPEFVDNIYPVDDRSSDETWSEIQRAATRVNGGELVVRPDGGEDNPRVVPLRHDQNQGVGAAVKTGYRRASEDGLDVVAVMNGDGQMDPDVLHRIINPVVEDAADYAKGNRLLSPDHWDGMSGWRLFGNFLLTYLTRIASGYWRIADPQNGYTAISVDIIDSIDLSSIYDEYGFLNDLLVYLNAQDARIADVEMRAVYGDETSSIRYHEFIPELSWLLVRGFLWRLNTKYLYNESRPLARPHVTGVAMIFLLLTMPFTLAPLDGFNSILTGGIVLIGCFILGCIVLLFDRRQNRGLETSIRRP